MATFLMAAAAGALLSLAAAPALATDDACGARAKADFTACKAKVRATRISGGVRKNASRACRAVYKTGRAVCGRSVDGSTAEVRTELLDYAPGETVVITGSGWSPGETVDIVLTEEPQTHDPTALSAVADDNGNFTNTAFAPEEHDVGVAFTITATGASSGFVAQAVFWDAKPPAECTQDSDCTDADACNTDSCNGGKCQHSGGGNLGTAVVTSVTPTDGGCVHLDAKENGVDAWDVQQGKTYTVTLTGVTECSGDSIGVIVKNSTDNLCPITATGGSGTYTFTVTMPNPGCNTFPILYCATDCDASTGVFASDGDCQQSHLRAATFDDCSDLAPDPDTNCSPDQCASGSISGRKFSDVNVNGADNSEPGIGGVKMTLTGPNSYTACTSTLTGGSYSFTTLSPGTYTVTETPPPGSIQTTPTSCTVTIDDRCNPASCNFGNVCLGAGGGLTLGFWSNKNGQSVMNDGGTVTPELTLLNDLCLANAPGNQTNFTNYSSFRTWLLNANATNMSYMLSAQLSAMELNVEAGFVGLGSYVYAPSLQSTCSYSTSFGFTTITNLMSIANTELCGDQYTPDGDANRTCQEIKKNALDAANNNRNFAVACPDVTGTTCP